jgi:hypothetical protein
LAFVASVSQVGVAQMPQLKRPQEDNEQKKPEPKKAKKVKGPRAVGLLQLNRSNKGTLIPIAIQVEGKFYDASVYKAEPVPMALESGTVYEVEQTGSSQGLFTINGALHSTTAGSPHTWTGSGMYLQNGTEVKKTTLKAEDIPVGINATDSDAPPRLTRGNSKPAEKGSANPAPASSAPASAGSSSDKPAENAAPASASGSPGSESSNQSASKPSSSTPADKPADQGDKAKDKATDNDNDKQQASNAAPTLTRPSGKSADRKSDEYRPTLRRGKPIQSPPPDDVDPKTGTPESPKMGPIKFIPAISDDGGPEPRSYKFYWKTGEEEERRSQMLALAGDELRAYTTALAKNSIPAKPTPVKPAPAKAAPAKSGAPRKTAAKPVPPVFENVQFNAFDVWGNNQPVMILTAEVHPPVTPGSTTAPETYSITLVARADIYGNLRKVYAGVTDRFHLDVTPRLELIDAVDADGDGRGELLFRETTDAGSGYVIYRPTADKLWKMFESNSSGQ